MKLNIQLFASNSASNSGLRSSGGNKGTVSVSFYEKELSDANKKNNTTTIVASASFKQDTGAYASVSSPMLYLYWYDSKSGQLVQKASQNVTAMNRYDVVTVSAEFDVVHKDDGTLEGYAKGEWNYSGGSAYVCKTGSATTALTTLTKVPRASGCWASDTNIGSTATINIEKASDTFTHTIKWASEGLSSTIATKTSANSLPFAIPTSLYAKIPNSTYATIALTIDTYDGDTLIGTRNDSTFKAIVFKEDNKPIVNPDLMTFTDDNAESVAITKDNTTFVKGISKLRITGGITARNSATLTSTKITNGGQTIDGYYTDDGDLAVTFPKAITSNVIEFNVVDSRGYDNSATYTIPSNKFLDYDAPKINANFIRNTATDGKVNVELSAGSYFVGTIGGKANSLTLKYRYRKKGTTTWSNPITITFDKNTSTGVVPQQTILLNETFNYRDSFEFELQYTDILGTYLIKDSISAGIPIFWWNREKFVVNGELQVTNNSGENAKNIFDLIYPVGSIYISVNETNPEILFGGKWEAFGEGRFLLGAGFPKANNTNFFGDLNNNNYGFYSEEMGGQYLHTLTWNEMPDHVHGIYYPNAGGPYGISGDSDEICYPSESGVTKTWGANMCNTMSAGQTHAHNNMPPYIGAYMWKRTA